MRFEGHGFAFCYQKIIDMLFFNLSQGPKIFLFKRGSDPVFLFNGPQKNRKKRFAFFSCKSVSWGFHGDYLTTQISEKQIF
jgi:hypothetical protein